MSYIDQNLAQGETVVYRAELHRAVFIGPAVGALFFVLIALPMSAVPDARVFALPCFPLALVLALSVGVRYIRYRTSEFAVTNKRILIKVGVFGARSLEILLSKVEAIGVNQSLIGRWLDYGTVTISGTGGTKEPFHSIRSPLAFRKKAQEQIA